MSAGYDNLVGHSIGRAVAALHDQFHAMWGREKRKSEFERLRTHRPPIVFHGLRKGATCKLLEAGCTAKQVAAVTGMSLNMVEYYSRAVDQLRLGDEAMEQWDRG